ncbi:MAG: LPXTG cell wall anchor domain-containing protein [Christensenellaceae bacterium]|nr:LPXTG cell wall anchor domain-containing protein [Christensenellaceae bacterium]
MADGQEINAGNYKAAAVSLSNANYALPENPTQNYTIEPAALYIPEQSVTYNGTNTLTADHVPTGVKGDMVTVTLVASAADVGSYAYGSGDQSYTATAANTNYRVIGGGMLHITPATPAVIWPKVNKTVYVNDPPLTFGDLSGGSATGVNGVSLHGDFIIEQVALRSWDSSGSHLFQVTFKPESTNYIDVTGSLLIKVDKRIVASVEPQAAITDKQFGTALADLGLPAAVTITTADGRTFENVPVTWSGYNPYTLTEQSLTGALDLRDIAHEVENPQNLMVSIVVRLLWFNSEAVDFPDKTVVYSGFSASHEIEGRIAGVAGIAYTYAGKDGTVYGPSSSAPINAGTYAVTAAFTMESGYPRIDAMTAALTIKQAPLFVPEQIVAYNGTTRFVVQDVPTGINDEKITFVLISTAAAAGEYTYGSGVWTYTASITDPNYVIAGGKLLTIVAPEAQTGAVTVRKQVKGKDGDEQAGFAFTVMLSDISLSGTYGDMVFVNGVATFTLKHGESKTAIGLPAGVRYSVVEQMANQDGYTTTAMGESGTIAADTTATAVFVNARDAADVPQTGDDSHIEWWLMLMGISVLVMVAGGFGLTRKKEK